MRNMVGEKRLLGTPQEKGPEVRTRRSGARAIGSRHHSKADSVRSTDNVCTGGRIRSLRDVALEYAKTHLQRMASQEEDVQDTYLEVVKSTPESALLEDAVGGRRWILLLRWAARGFWPCSSG